MTNKLDQIKNNLLDGLRPHDEQIKWLIKVAETASEFVESFEWYSEDTYHNCITGPQRSCRELRKVLNDG